MSLDLTFGFEVGVALAIFHIFNSASFSILEKVVTEKTTFFFVKFFILDEKLILLGSAIASFKVPLSKS